ncbi:Uncharacterised protein [Campylobacter sputorum subsp. bubulus]|uniref:Uncharacterized protein n=1 Tax=Campylobacter sputorum subsp. sputorum TaxID=32024 RepID=A0A381DIT4_9BACT|nr:hypothetical protein [Campylobacter sputorum]ASM35620.1 hypothetical protein CSPUT_1435 [Campylobacter sputorum aubsp. sputorum RM3237]KAB0582650.1 hypothetical protein F7P64_00445 [Campylobacter sputorum subsp. sputorum]QEL05811.1 hypothetical protein CSPT_1432 [Campylobacter sputorum subsp. sputorum]SUX08028.1 Uncharacterised protein [Campylobacter sputorum subsp. bubulus]SUX10589.1 Uncharacterised protein [Campylobacter sputorum subsp. sputorum]
MPVSAIGSTIYVNQNMGVAASTQNDFQARLDAQNLAMLEATNKDKKEVEEVRPAEEIYKIDPEREHEKKHADAQEEAQEEAQKTQNKDENKEENDLEEELDDSIEGQILDIKI